MRRQRGNSLLIRSNCHCLKIYQHIHSLYPSTQRLSSMYIPLPRFSLSLDMHANDIGTIQTSGTRFKNRRFILKLRRRSYSTMGIHASYILASRTCFRQRHRQWSHHRRKRSRKVHPCNSRHETTPCSM